MLWHASGATAASVAALGGYGYATGRQHSSWTRSLIWALIALIAFGIVTTFFTMPGVHVIFAVASLGIFGAFTLVDFDRVTRAGEASAALIAANIFLDIFELIVSSFDDSHQATPGLSQRALGSAAWSSAQSSA